RPRPAAGARRGEGSPGPAGEPAAMITRKTCAATGCSALSAIAIARYPAGAAEFTYKLAHSDPVAYPPSVFLQQAADKVKVDSNGRMEVQVFPNNTLGGSSELV